LASLNTYIGSQDAKIGAENDKNVCKSLLTLGYVKYSAGDEGRGASYEITASGKKALAAK
jgi:hypothetical protein